MHWTFYGMLLSVALMGVSQITMHWVAKKQQALINRLLDQSKRDAERIDSLLKDMIAMNTIHRDFYERMIEQGKL